MRSRGTETRASSPPQSVGGIWRHPWRERKVQLVMRNLVRLANWGHRQRSVLVRRGALVVAMVGLAFWQAIWWLVLIPAFVIGYAPIAAAIAFFKALVEIPRLTGNQLFDDIDEWRLNIPGAVRIWRAQKVEPETVRKP